MTVLKLQVYKTESIYQIHKWRPTWVNLVAKHEIEAF